MAPKSRFLHPNSFAKGETISLSREESHHLSKVLRMKEGDEVEVFDGQGIFGVGKVLSSKASASLVEVVSAEKDMNPPRVRLCFAFPKAAAAEFILKRCTELGVEGFQILETKHSVPPKNWNRLRWERIILEAAKQSQENFLPQLGEPITLSKFLESRDQKKTLFVCDEENRAASPTIPSKPMDVLVGAEGGWSREEISQVEKSGGLFLGLGKNRLRTETAALTALIRLNFSI